MNWGFLLLNAAYAVYVLSPVFKDMLRLRVVLLAATILFIAYGASESVWSVFWWNIPFGIIQTWQIWLLLQQRRAIDLDEEADAVRTLLFPDLDRTLFNVLWNEGVERLELDDVLIRAGQPVHELLLVLDGEVDVDLRPQAEVTVRLGRLRFFGEMSAVRGSTASATVSAVGEVRLRAWDKLDLRELDRKHPEIERAMLRAIGHELAQKLS